MGLNYLLSIYFFLLGLIVGSFSNVCILRIPLNKSIIFPASHCPKCKKKIKWFDNIPILSWIILLGKCRECKTAISIIYPAVELANGIIFAFNFYYRGDIMLSLLYSLLCSSFLIITIIDYRHKIIPDIITLPGIIAGLLASIIFNNISTYDAFIGFLTGGGLFFLIALASKGGMGGGDIKLMAMIGAFMGWKNTLLTTFIGSTTGSVIGIGLMLAGKKGRKDQIPFGPFLTFGATISLFYGEKLIKWYFYPIK